MDARPRDARKADASGLHTTQVMFGVTLCLGKIVFLLHSTCNFALLLRLELQVRSLKQLGSCRAAWELRLEAAPGGSAWRQRLEAVPGGSPWRQRVAAAPGGNAWRQRLEAVPGGSAWKQHLETAPGGRAWPHKSYRIFLRFEAVAPSGRCRAASHSPV